MGLCNILVFRINPIMLNETYYVEFLVVLYPIMLNTLLCLMKPIMFNETYYVEHPIMLKPIMFNELHRLLY